MADASCSAADHNPWAATTATSLGSVSTVDSDRAIRRPVIVATEAAGTA